MFTYVYLYINILLCCFFFIGYVYEGMYRAKKGIKKLFRNNKELYKPYTQIIKKRWDKMLRKSLHAAAYWLNPVFQYDQDSFCKKPEVVNGVTDMIERYNKAGSACGLTIMAGLSKFREREDSFSRSLAFASRGTTRPGEHDIFKLLLSGVYIKIIIILFNIVSLLSIR